jgi:hypothetical protein
MAEDAPKDDLARAPTVQELGYHFLDIETGGRL